MGDNNWRLHFEALLAVLTIIMTPFVWRRLGEGYALYTILNVIIPAATGNLDSMTRYVLVIFPIFMLLGSWGRHSILDKAITIGSTLLLGVFTAAFVNGLFIG